MKRTSVITLLLVASIQTKAFAAACERQVLDAGSLKAEMAGRVADPYPFFGLSSYLNAVRYFRVSEKNIKSLPHDAEVMLEDGEWFAAVGRFNVVAIQAKDATVKIAGRVGTIKAAEYLFACKTGKNGLKKIDPSLDRLRYAHLWFPLQLLSKGAEWCIAALQRLTINWGAAIILFAVLLKIFTLPVSLLTGRFQRDVSKYQAILAPQLADIKQRYKGEEAHNKWMDAHKELNLSPFYTLKPLASALIQIPLLIAAFNALAEMPQLNGQNFLWMDLAYPDSVMRIPFEIPFLGKEISFLPFLMAAMTLLSTLGFQNHHAPTEVARRQKRNLYLMTLGFFVLFYPFPSAMVLFWTASNIFYAVQQFITNRLRIGF